MERVKLLTSLPPRTAELDRFEASLKRLNQFYWAGICALDVAASAAQGAGVARLSDFVPTGSWQRLDITSAEFLALREEFVMTARWTMLVQAVTYFEEYLRSALRAYLLRTLKPQKQYSVRVRLADFEGDDIQTQLCNAILDAEVASIVNAKYSERTQRLKNLLSECGTTQNVDITMRDDTLLVAANEVRNCIVHCAGIADSRAVESLADVFPGLRKGDPLPMGDDALWQLLGAVRDGARAVDVAIRNSGAGEV